ncbi:DNA mismatch endonuclease Vsr [Akkermansiaceae bacterium]|nr:DNA mismatch endonuclease Vsr [Akkermansiaceae bacterium]
MADIFSKDQRSYIMSCIRGRDTKPEVALRSMLHGMGYRFTVNGPNNRGLPGRPDIVLPRYGTVIFMHGCFWHGHENCPDFKMPKSRREWWQAKISGNKARDMRVEEELRGMGWHVVTIWACAVKNSHARMWLETRLPALIGDVPQIAEDPLPKVAEEYAPYRVNGTGQDPR